MTKNLSEYLKYLPNALHCLSHDLPTRNQIHMDLASIKICTKLFQNSYAKRTDLNISYSTREEILFGDSQRSELGQPFNKANFIRFFPDNWLYWF